MGAAPAGLDLLVRPERAEASLWRRFGATRQGRLRENLFDRYYRFARSLARRHALSAVLPGRGEQTLHHGLVTQVLWRHRIDLIDLRSRARAAL